MAALGNLPTEIVIQIMNYCSNLSCLWSLVNTSSRFNLIFMTRAWVIVHNVIIKTTPSCIQALMGTVIAINMSPELFNGISDIVDYISQCKKIADVRDEVGTTRSGEKSLGLMLQRMPPQALREFVTAAHNMHGVAHACLEFYIEKSLSAKPQRLEFHGAQDYEKLMRALYSRLQTPGQPFQPKEYGPPTYLEEQIVIRAIWYLQLFLDMKTAYRKGALAHWREEDRNNFQTSVDISEIVLFARGLAFKMNYSCIEQFLSVIDFIQETTEDQNSPIEDVLTRFLRCAPLAVHNKTYHVSCCPKPNPFFHKNGLREKPVDVDSMIARNTMGCHFYRVMTARLSQPLMHVSFQPWRRLGFALWQVDRMIELGFLGTPESGYGLVGDKKPCFIWRSILTPEEDAAEQYQQEETAGVH